MAELSARGEYFATITVIGSKGSSPRVLGGKMIVLEDGSRIGTVGGDCFENDAVGMPRVP
jgi:xanthine dehydrogenase accessory factor